MGRRLTRELRFYSHVLKTRKGTGWKFRLSAPQLRRLGPEHKSNRVTRPRAKRQTPEAKGRIFRVRLTRGPVGLHWEDGFKSLEPPGSLFPPP